MAYSEHCQTSKIKVFPKIVNSLELLDKFKKKLRLRYLREFWIRLLNTPKKKNLQKTSLRLLCPCFTLISSSRKLVKLTILTKHFKLDTWQCPEYTPVISYLQGMKNSLSSSHILDRTSQGSFTSERDVFDLELFMFYLELFIFMFYLIFYLYFLNITVYQTFWIRLALVAKLDL